MPRPCSALSPPPSFASARFGPLSRAAAAAQVSARRALPLFPPCRMVVSGPPALVRRCPRGSGEITWGGRGWGGVGGENGGHVRSRPALAGLRRAPGRRCRVAALPRERCAVPARAGACAGPPRAGPALAQSGERGLAGRGFAFRSGVKELWLGGRRDELIPSICNAAVLNLCSPVRRMRYVAAYLLAVLGGNESPTSKDLKKILDSVGIETDDERMNKVALPLNSGCPSQHQTPELFPWLQCSLCLPADLLLHCSDIH